MTGIPVYNVNNNCSTGSSALYLGKQIIESQNADCVLALGFEKMQSGSLSSTVSHNYFVLYYVYLCYNIYLKICLLRMYFSFQIEQIQWINM